MVSCGRYGCMRLGTWAAALCAICLLAGCGAEVQASPDAETRVRKWLPKAKDIRCTSPRKQVMSCEVTVRKRPVGTEHWHCSFESVERDGATAGASACWTEDGSQESLGRTARLY